MRTNFPPLHKQNVLGRELPGQGFLAKELTCTTYVRKAETLEVSEAASSYRVGSFVYCYLAAVTWKGRTQLPTCCLGKEQVRHVHRC